MDLFSFISLFAKHGFGFGFFSSTFFASFSPVTYLHTSLGLMLPRDSSIPSFPHTLAHNTGQEEEKHTS